MEVLLIDRFPIIRLGIREVLKKTLDNGAIIHEEEDPGNLRQRRTPALLVIGLNSLLSFNDNIGIVEKLRNAYPGSKIIVYRSDSDPPEWIPHYLETGIQGFVNLGGSIEGFAECIQAVLSGKRYVSADVMEWILSVHFSSDGQKQLTKKHGRIQLTSREQEIANYLTQGKRISWIAGHIGRKASTISTIKNNIHRKTKTDNVLQLKELLERAPDKAGFLKNRPV